MTDMTQAEKFMGEVVAREAHKREMYAGWNGDITDFPSWEVGYESTGAIGYIGFTGEAWDVEVHVDSSSYTLPAADLGAALDRLAEWAPLATGVDAMRDDLQAQIELGVKLGATISGLKAGLREIGTLVGALPEGRVPIAAREKVLAIIAGLS